jgi:hypothetical protein
MSKARLCLVCTLGTRNPQDPYRVSSFPDFTALRPEPRHAFLLVLVMSLVSAIICLDVLDQKCGDIVGADLMAQLT